MKWIEDPGKPRAAFACARCGKHFVSQEALRNHTAQCEEQEPAHTRSAELRHAR